MAQISGTTFRRILAITVGVPVLMMTVCAITLALLTGHLFQLMQQGRHSVQVLSTFHECEKLLIDMETGERGFKMTGDEGFLDPYKAANGPLDAQFADLVSLVADDPDQKDRVDTLQKSVKDWRELAAHSIQAGKYNFSPEALAEELDGKARMDSIREQISSLLQEEEDQLSVRRSETDTTKHVVLFSEIVALGLVIILTGLHVRRQMQKLAGFYETSLREVAMQKEWFRVTLASIGDAVMVTDKNGLTTFMNFEAERMTGWQMHEADGKPLRSVFRIVHEETRVPGDDPVEKVFQEKRIVGLANHTLLISKSGAEWPIEDSAAPIYDSERCIAGVVLVFRDATEMRRAERVLKTHAEDLEQKVLARTVELQRTINELEAFSYTVSHDLRAPLRAMQGYSSALLNDYATKWSVEERGLLSRISKASERLDVLIQDLLTYSRVSKEHQAIVPVNLDRLVQDILAQYPTFQNPELSFEVQHPLHPVLGHESGLTQVISNLLTNAVKFVVPGGKPKIKIWTQAEEFTVRLWIEDNGIGIDPKNHSRIFKMFEQIGGKK